MVEWVDEWLRKQRQQGKKRLEVKRLKNHFYVYDSTTYWDKEKKKVRKKSVYLGKLTPGGLKEVEKKIHPRTAYEYCNSKLLEDQMSGLLPLLKDHFPSCYQEILAMAVVKVISPQPLKLIGTQWSKLYLSTKYDPSTSPAKLSQTLKVIGSDLAEQNKFFHKLMKDDKFLLYDLSYVFSHSENLQLAEKGYNKDHKHIPQVNLALVFSIDQKLPVMIRVMPGSVRDIKSFKNALETVKLSPATVVVDRGMASMDLIPLIEEKKLSYVLPLKRNFKVIDYDLELDQYFTYHGRAIKAGKKKLGKRNLYIFEDVKLRGEEEGSFIEKIINQNKTPEDLEKEKQKFGKITMISDLDIEAEEIYLMYKQREDIECAFDILKNPLESDKTYLREDSAVKGYFFIAFISLYIYYQIMNLLRKKDMLKKTSVKELLLQLSKVHIITDGKKELMTEIPKKTETLNTQLQLNLFPNS